MTNEKTANPVTQYIQQFPAPVQEIMHTLRNLILQIAPDAEESISYGMPAYKTHKKPLVYFAGYKNHIGLYATPSGHEAFKDALADYKQGKGSVQFPLDQPIPYALIERIVRFRVVENEGRGE